MISWEKRRSGIGQLYGWAEQLACEAIDWYMFEKKRKARWSRSLRALAAILATVGGTIPVAALAAGKSTFGNWGFVLLALAAGCVAYDRFFGYSSAWLRYMATAINLRSQLSEFQLTWVSEIAALGDGEPPAGEVHRLIDLVQSFVSGVNDTVRGETQSWLVEFNTNMSELESRLRQSQSTPTTAGSTVMADSEQRSISTDLAE